jgi:hypothetical protein
MANELKLQLTDDNLKAIMSEAIMTALTEEQRAVLIKGALQYLLTAPPSSGYNSRPPTTPIQDAFNEAVRKVAFKVCEEAVSADGELKRQIDTLVADVAKRAFAEDRREKLITKMADAVTSALTGERY